MVLALGAAVLALRYILFESPTEPGNVAQPMQFYDDLSQGAVGTHADAWAAFLSGAPGWSATAFRLFLPLARQGYADAQFVVDTFFSNGIPGVVPQDRGQAYVWYSLAAANFEDEYWRESAARNCDLVAAKMNDEQVAGAQRLVRAWKPEPRETLAAPDWRDHRLARRLQCAR